MEILRADILAWHTLRVTVYVRIECQVLLRQFMIMRWLLSFLVLACVAVVRATSFTGNRLLVVLDEQAEREKYSVFLEDLEGKCSFLQFRRLGSCEQASKMLKSSISVLWLLNLRNACRVSLQDGLKIA